MMSLKKKQWSFLNLLFVVMVTANISTGILVGTVAVLYEEPYLLFFSAFSFAVAYYIYRTRHRYEF